MWLDNASSVDMLFYSPYADTVVKFAKNSALTPLTIGLYGSWGAGKSSLLNLINDKLSKLDKEERIACVSLNAWQFEGYEDAKIAIMEALLKSLNEKKTHMSRISHVRQARCCCSVLVKERTAAEGLIALEVIARVSGGSIFVESTAAAVFVLSTFFGFGAGKFNVVQNNDRLTFGSAGLPIGPDILVISAGQVDERSVLELHLFDALAEVTKGLDVDIDPAGVVFGVLVIDTFADAEADDVPVVGILEGRLVVEAPGDDCVCSGKAQHKIAPFCRICPAAKCVFQPA